MDRQGIVPGVVLNGAVVAFIADLGGDEVDSGRKGWIHVLEDYGCRWMCLEVLVKVCTLRR